MDCSIAQQTDERMSLSRGACDGRAAEQDRLQEQLCESAAVWFPSACPSDDPCRTSFTGGQAPEVCLCSTSGTACTMASKGGG